MSCLLSRTDPAAACGVGLTLRSRKSCALVQGCVTSLPAPPPPAPSAGVLSQPQNPVPAPAAACQSLGQSEATLLSQQLLRVESDKVQNLPQGCRGALPPWGQLPAAFWESWALA